MKETKITRTKSYNCGNIIASCSEDITEEHGLLNDFFEAVAFEAAAGQVFNEFYKDRKRGGLDRNGIVRFIASCREEIKRIAVELEREHQ